MARKRHWSIKAILIAGTAVALLLVVPELWQTLNYQRALHRLDTGTPGEVAKAREYLVSRGAAAAERLLAEFARPERDKRVIAGLIRSIGLKSVRPKISSALAHGTESERIGAIRAIGWLEDESWIPDLLALAAPDNEELFRAVVVSLVMLQAEQAKPLLREHLVKGRAAIRGICANALGQLQDRQAVPLLRRATNDSSAYVSHEASKALAAMEMDLQREALEGE